MPTFRIQGIFKDQRGIVERGRIVGYNSNGMPVREYRWVEPEDPALKGKTFEAFDDQIKKARKK